MVHEAERAVCTIKELLNKSEDPCLALLAYHITPIQGGEYSPCQLLMSRMLRTTVPTTRADRAPCVPDSAVVCARDNRVKATQSRILIITMEYVSYHPSSQATQFGFLTGSKRPRWTLKWTHRVQVTTADGSSYRRNRKDIIQLPDPGPPEEESRNPTDQ